MTRPLGSQTYRITLDKQTSDMLRQYAAASRQLMTRVAAAIVTDFLAARAEMGDGIPGGNAVKRTPIFQELLQGMEQRQAVTINAQSEQLREIQRIGERVSVMVEHLLRKKDGV